MLDQGAEARHSLEADTGNVGHGRCGSPHEGYTVKVLGIHGTVLGRPRPLDTMLLHGGGNPPVSREEAAGPDSRCMINASESSLTHFRMLLKPLLPLVQHLSSSILLQSRQQAPCGVCAASSVFETSFWARSSSVSEARSTQPRPGYVAATAAEASGAGVSRARPGCSPRPSCASVLCEVRSVRASVSRPLLA